LDAVTAATSVLHIRPRLKPHVDTYRHIYRGVVWYLFHDRALDRFYRISGPGADIVGALDGKRSLGEIYEDWRARRPSEDVESHHVSDFIVQMNALGLLRAGSVPNTEDVQNKRSVMARRKFWASLKSPLSLRIPLFDPTQLLDALAPLGRLIFSRFGAALWIAMVLMGIVIGALHFGQLRADFSDRLISLENLAVVGLIYPLIKVLHETGHGLALRRFGAEVHRIGILFIAFVPVPYVDASHSILLPSKYQRMAVAGAGILTELFIASLAMLGWVASEPSLFHTACYNILLISGLSTLLFNGNPLQRYDGYYLLCDFAEIPSLGMRATQYITYLFRKTMLADERIRAPAVTASERRWFLIYGPLSAVYRTWLVFSIAFFVARSYPLLGGGLALWSTVGALSGPVVGLYRMARLPPSPTRNKAWKRLGILIGSIVVLLALIPLPLRLVEPGVVWLPEEANIRPHVSGEVKELHVAPGQHVDAGQPIFTLDDAEVRARLSKSDGELAEMDAERTRLAASDIVGAGKEQDRIVAARASRKEAMADSDSLVVRSPAAGIVIFKDYGDLPGRYVAKGQAPAVVWNGDKVVIRTMVKPDDIDLVRNRSRGIGIRTDYDQGTVLPGHVLRIVPTATDRLPSAVLSVDGGGPFAVTADPRDEQHQPDESLDLVSQNGLHVAGSLFEVDVQCDAPMPAGFLNGLAHVRFELGWEPVIFRLVRGLRVVFLRFSNA
jgi:putative peptide zinc metalloprotease protein